MSDAAALKWADKMAETAKTTNFTGRVFCKHCTWLDSFDSWETVVHRRDCPVGMYLRIRRRDAAKERP